MSLFSKTTFLKVFIAVVCMAILFGIWSVSSREKPSIESNQDEIVGLQYDQMIPLVLDLLSHHKVSVETYRANYTNWLAHKPKDSDDISKYYIHLLHEIFSNDQFFQIILGSVLNEADPKSGFPLRYEDKVYLLNLAFTYHTPEADILADIKAGYDPLTARVSGILDRLNNETWIFDFDHGDGNHNQNHSYVLIVRNADDHFTSKLLLKKLAEQSYFNPQSGVLTIITKGGTAISDYLESKYRLENNTFTTVYEDVSLRGDVEQSWTYEQFPH